MLWVDDHQDGQGDGVQDKKLRDWICSPWKKKKTKGDITAPFHLTRKGYREDGMRPFSEVHNV